MRHVARFGRGRAARGLQLPGVGRGVRAVLWYGSAESGADRPVPIADVLRPELHGVAKYYLEDRGRDEHWGEL